MQEEELKGRIADAYFDKFDTNNIIGKIDFCVALKMPKEAVEAGIKFYSLFWAEAKRGTSADICDSVVQLILTIGRARTHRNCTPPKWIGAFDEEKIAFVPFEDVHDVLEQNDFNWNVKASDHTTREFCHLKEIVGGSIEANSRIFYYKSDDAALRKFIKTNIGTGEIQKIEVDKNNFTGVYDIWCRMVKPTLCVDSWSDFNEELIMSSDFFLADLMSDIDEETKTYCTFIDKLRVVLCYNKYYEVRFQHRKGKLNLDTSAKIRFNDKQKAHTLFWNIYKRPPKKEYIEHILNRRDLLVPQDVRERKGAFFTPQKWVRLSQQYITNALGENWQDEYVVWDCCAGTGNLLVGLTNKKNLWASTLDQADVDIMKERASNGANLLENHIFQFDFLNDEFDESKVPEKLLKIIKDPKKRSKLLIYINPPYAESGNKRQVTGNGVNKSGTAVDTMVWQKYRENMGAASNELFAQFFIRIRKELSGSVLAEFSKLKILQAPNFAKFRSEFACDMKNSFIVPGDSFDNVKGKFPIGFFVWDTKKQAEITTCETDVYLANGQWFDKKTLYRTDGNKLIAEWAGENIGGDDERPIGYITFTGSDFQNNMYLYISNGRPKKNHHTVIRITKGNLYAAVVHLAVRMCVASSWINDRDQFLYPDEKWYRSKEFLNDCLAYTLFHSQNRITTENGTNHWIPFTETELEQTKDDFASHFMSDFINGNKITDPTDDDDGGYTSDDLPRSYASGKSNRKGGKGGMTSMFYEQTAEYDTGKIITNPRAISFSEEAQNVIDAGKDLWKYYIHTDGANINASFYDIRKFFQGTKGNKMNPSSNDEEYTKLMSALKDQMKTLGAKIAEKAYDYRFLR